MAVVLGVFLPGAGSQELYSGIRGVLGIVGVGIVGVIAIPGVPGVPRSDWIGQGSGGAGRMVLAILPPRGCEGRGNTGLACTRPPEGLNSVSGFRDLPHIARACLRIAILIRKPAIPSSGEDIRGPLQGLVCSGQAVPGGRW